MKKTGGRKSRWTVPLSLGLWLRLHFSQLRHVLCRSVGRRTFTFWSLTFIYSSNLGLLYTPFPCSNTFRMFKPLSIPKSWQCCGVDFMTKNCYICTAQMMKMKWLHICIIKNWRSFRSKRRSRQNKEGKFLEPVKGIRPILCFLCVVLLQTSLFKGSVPRDFRTSSLSWIAPNWYPDKIVLNLVSIALTLTSISQNQLQMSKFWGAYNVFRYRVPANGQL